MKMLKENRKIKRIIALVCIVAMLATLAYADTSSQSSDTSGLRKIKSSVTLGNKTYTKDNPLQILEIVPDKSYSMLGYMVGGENCPVTWEQIVAVENPEARVKLMQEWLVAVQKAIYGTTGSQIQVRIQNYVMGTYQWEYYTTSSGNWRNLSADKAKFETAELSVRKTSWGSDEVYSYLDDNGNVVNTTNLFAYYIFGEKYGADKEYMKYNMCDKIKVTSKLAGEVTMEDIDNSDLIYVNNGNGASEIYNMYNHYMAQVDENYQERTSQGSESAFDAFGEDLSAEVMWKLYRDVVDNKVALIYDTNTCHYGEALNIIILGTLLFGAEWDIFYEHFWQDDSQAQDNIWKGTKGQIEIKDGQITASYYKNGESTLTVIPWGHGCFMNKPELADPDTNMWDNYYHNETTLYNMFSVHRNVFRINYGYLAFSSEYGKTESKDLYKYGYDTEKEGHLYNGSKEAVNIMYDNPDSQYGISILKAIRYILDDYKITQLYTGEINVLEIEPSGAYKYSPLDNDGAKKIYDYFGFYLDDADYVPHVNVTSIAMNGFIGFEEDLTSNYDLIIISDNNPDGYIDTSITKIYTQSGPTTQLTDYANGKTTYTAALSGNDLTVKAYNRLIEYIKKGMPLVLADSIYYGDTNVVDTDTNVAALSYENLAATLGEANLGNVISESNDDEVTLIYCERPKLTMNSNLSYKVDSNGIAIPNVDKSELSALEVGGVIENYDSRSTYSLKVYVDKDANGIYAETTNDDNELLGDFDRLSVNSDGSFKVKLQEMPDTLRGYLQWKAVLTNNKNGMTADEEGAIVISYAKDEMRTIKVLQISPGGKVTLTLNDSKFMQLFEATGSVTGLKMDVTVLTCEQFEALYTNNPFSIVNGVPKNDILTKLGESGFDILVLGFSDIYSNNDISDKNGALSNIKYYIEMGNSVLMSHDVISFTAYSDSNNINKVTDFANSSKNKQWSYNITSQLRDIIGMDRYGVSQGESSDVTYNQGFANIFLQRFASNGGVRLKLYTGMNALTDNKYLVTSNVRKLNNGQITEYPYSIPDTLKVADTHAQYFQLDLEQQGETEENDVIVWYTLDKSGNNNNTYYNYTGQDALNDYYIYSKGNITYSGAGHSTVSGDAEIKLFINTIIRAIGAGNNLPAPTFEDEISITDSRYEKTLRGDEESITIKYSVHDEDMSVRGIFKRGYVFCDINSNGIYDEEDILFKEYSNDSDDKLINGQIYEMDLSQYIDDGSTYLSADEKDEIKARLNGNTLTITIEAIDNNKGVGIATLDIINKNLFDLN